MIRSKKFEFDSVIGAASIGIGIICLVECKRLFPLRSSLLSGDHALVGLTGFSMIFLGFLLLLFKAKQKPPKVVYPGKSMMLRIILILGILSIYAASLKFLGYILSTVLFGIPLFRLFGGYKWLQCIISSALCTMGLYVVFISGLGMSFPRGLIF
ncbi:MAG: tripartite tricarboxylate transporter TctB family protein [Spirochaetales bacterium]|nr:tripartite tricarboxylate transporter TctB family protein [Spirochaetales bacterium]